MRILIALVLGVVLTAACSPRPLVAPEVLVRPGVVGLGSQVSVRLYGAEIANYRFMGAVPISDGIWIVRLDPVRLGMQLEPAQVGVRTGDIVPLGENPAVQVEFVTINPTELVLRAVSVHSLQTWD